MAITKDPIVKTPNFSIITPGGCNARCNFCFWENRKPCKNYMEKLEESLLKMPNPYFNQISITGGEPTLSPVFGKIISLLKTEKIRERYTKTVLTTNGCVLGVFIEDLEGAIKHVNISRHSESDVTNREVFGTQSVPTKEKLKEYCDRLHNIGIDLTISAVLSEHINTVEDINNYIEFANWVGADAVALRIEHGSIEEHRLEKEFSHIEFKEHNCGVCRHRKQTINGMLVTWKSSVSEPSNDLNGIIYEAVFNQDGTLTKDWESKHEILFHS